MYNEHIKRNNADLRHSIEALQLNSLHEFIRRWTVSLELSACRIMWQRYLTFWRRHFGLCRAAAHSDCCLFAPCIQIFLLTYLLTKHDRIQYPLATRRILVASRRLRNLSAPFSSRQTTRRVDASFTRSAVSDLWSSHGRQATAPDWASLIHSIRRFCVAIAIASICDVMVCRVGQKLARFGTGISVRVVITAIGLTHAHHQHHRGHQGNETLVQTPAHCSWKKECDLLEHHNH